MSEHRMKNLERAVAARTEFARARAEFKDDLGRMDPGEAARLLAGRLVDDPSAIGRFPVGELLCAVPFVGKTKARLLARMSGRIGLSERVGDLDRDQREALAGALRDYAWVVERRDAA